jgi:hypothetical protein
MILQGHIEPTWNIEQIKTFPYKLDSYKGEEKNALYVSKGHCEQSLHLYNCFEQNLPTEILSLKDQFTFLKKVSLAINLFTPGQYLPLHGDLYTRYRELHNLKNENIVRIMLFLEDWVPGQICQIEKQAFTDWKSGDWYGWKNDDIHTFYNLSLEDRYAIQITGIFQQD